MCDMEQGVLETNHWVHVVLSLREAGVSTDDMAQALRQETVWIEALLSMARDPVARALLNAERLSSVEAWAQFMSLTPIARKRLLESSEPISLALCQRAAREHRNAQRQGVSA